MKATITLRKNKYDNLVLFGLIIFNPTEKTLFVTAEFGMHVYFKKLQPKLVSKTREKIPTESLPSMLALRPSNRAFLTKKVISHFGNRK